MESIPATYWMVILAGLSILLGLIMFYIAMMFRQLVMTLEETTLILQKSHSLINQATAIVGTVKAMVNKVQENLIDPLLAVGRVFKIISSFVEGILPQLPQSVSKD